MEWLKLSQEEINDIIKKAQCGDKELESYLISQNLGLIRSAVKRFLNRGCEYDDLMQIGSIGLLKAIKNYDSSYNVRFSTYAVPMIIGEIKRFLRDDGAIKVSRNLKEIAVKAYSLREEIEKNTGKEPTIIELAVKLDVTKEELVMAMNSQSSTLSLHELVSQEEGSTIELIDRIQNDESCESGIINQIILKELLFTLEKKERQIIVLRYFKEMTQCQIAKILGISQVQVSRIEKKILGKLKERMG